MVRPVDVLLEFLRAQQARGLSHLHLDPEARTGLRALNEWARAGRKPALTDAAPAVSDGKTGFQPVREDSASSLSANETTGLKPVGQDRLETCPPSEAELYQALVLGLRDYVTKCGFSSVCLGLSGGIDSALTAAIAAAALGPENVYGLTLPSAYSSAGSVDDSLALARHLGIRCDVVPIGGPFEAVKSAMAGLFAGEPEDVTEENMQARIRGLLLMALSNKHHHLLLTTGNKSELAVGYCTIYGDMCGGLAVISDLPKVRVYQVSRWLNRDREIIPWNTIDKPPSAELRPDQKDQDTLPPYETLDAILELYIEHQLATDDIIAKGFDETTVRWIQRRVDLNEWKRHQAAPGLRVTSKAFGVGRRMPIVQQFVG